MAEIVNLRQARKNRARAEKEKNAEANRVLHGTPKAARKLEQARRQQADSRTEGHKLDGDLDDK